MDIQKKNTWKIYLPFFILLIIWGMYHILILPCYADDVNLFQNVLDGTTMSEFLSSRYYSWSSRILIELVLVKMVEYPVLWKILDTFLMVALTYMLSKLLDKSHKYAWFVSFFMLIYPFIDMSNAGWISTTLNYLWPMCGIVFLCTLLKKAITTGSLKIYEYIAGAFCGFFTCNHEQAAVIVLGLFLGFGVADWIKHRTFRPYILLLTFIDMVSLIFILTCPGNDVRMKHAIACGAAPDFGDFSLVKKLELGLFNIQRIFVSETNWFFLTFLVILVFLLWKSTHHTKKILATLPMLLVVFGYQICNRFIPASQTLFPIPERSFEIKEFSVTTLIKLLMLTLLIISILVCIYLLVNKNLTDFLHLVLVLACGFGSAVMLGLSPSVFESDTRIFIFLYLSLIYTIAFCYQKVRNTITLSKAEHYVYTALCILWASYQICYIVSNIIGRRSWHA